MEKEEKELEKQIKKEEKEKEKNKKSSNKSVLQIKLGKLALKIGYIGN